MAPSFWTWKTVAKLIDGVTLSEPREIELFKQCTGPTLPTKPVKRLIVLVGRRGGKKRGRQSRPLRKISHQV
jgi:hypothetical protein